MTSKPAIRWEFLDFGALDTARLYAILKARGEVFAVEQNIAYLDPDDMDQKAHHLIGWAAPNAIAAYLRLIAPGVKYHEPAIGRVLTSAQWRGKGLGRELTKRAVEHAKKLYPGHGVRMSAQHYLEKFYREFGFETVSEPYEEEDIMHVEMLLAGTK